MPVLRSTTRTATRLVGSTAPPNILRNIRKGDALRKKSRVDDVATTTVSRNNSKKKSIRRSRSKVIPPPIAPADSKALLVLSIPELVFNILEFLPAEDLLYNVSRIDCFYKACARYELGRRWKAWELKKPGDRAYIPPYKKSLLPVNLRKTSSAKLEKLLPERKKITKERARARDKLLAFQDAKPAILPGFMSLTMLLANQNPQGPRQIATKLAHYILNPSKLYLTCPPVKRLKVKIRADFPRSHTDDGQTSQSDAHIHHHKAKFYITNYNGITVQFFLDALKYNNATVHEDFDLQIRTLEYNPQREEGNVWIEAATLSPRRRAVLKVDEDGFVLKYGGERKTKLKAYRTLTMFTEMVY